MSELILVRHGESEHHVQRLSGGWTDTPLTDFGRRQARRTGEALAKLLPDGFARLLSSDLKRASQTADEIAAAAGIEAEFDLGLRESNNGIAIGKTIEWVRKNELPETEPAVDWVPHPGAESWRAMTDRVTGFMARAVTRSPSEPVVVVSHGNSLIAIVHWWLGLGEEHWPQITYTFDPASITRLGLNGRGERVIAKMNDTSHLAGL